MTTTTSLERDLLRTVEVFDPNGQRSVLLEGLRESATVAEIRTRAVGGLRLPPDFNWNVRHEQSGRLLQEEQRLGEFAEQTHVKLTMQPDAGLG